MDNGLPPFRKKTSERFTPFFPLVKVVNASALSLPNFWANSAGLKLLQTNAYEQGSLIFIANCTNKLEINFFVSFFIIMDIHL
jgi:hypothetical protein